MVLTAGEAGSSGTHRSFPEAETVRLWRVSVSCERGEQRTDNVVKETVTGEAYKRIQIPNEDLVPTEEQGQQDVGRLQSRWREGGLQKRDPGSHLP